MSSKNNHIKPVLTLANYEEYFLLYVDAELTPEAKKAVDDFVLLHPALKEELDILCSTRLPAENLSFGTKEILFADSMKLDAMDESLLLYIDNELPAAEIEKIETRLKSDDLFALQHTLLLKTKLDKEPLVYPHKKALYRSTERRIAPVWLRIAAAVVLVAGAGTAAWMGMDKSKNPGANVAVNTPKKSTQPITPDSKQIETLIVTEDAKTVAANTKNNLPNEKNSMPGNTVAVAKHVAKKAQDPTFSKPHAGVNTLALSNKLPVAKKTDITIAQTDPAKKISKPAVNNSVVTSAIAPAYVPIDATAKTTVPVTAVATTAGNEKSGGMKGFLRKATRFIERRTGIKTVNDDDELLVGTVALKL